MTVMTPAARTQTIAFLSSGAKEANEALERLTALYGNSPFDQASVIVALGGDGLMLQTLHMTMKAPKPIYGMNRGSVGFLMNDYSEQGLPERLRAAQPSIIHPLIMRTRDINGAEHDSASDQRGVAVAPDLSGGEVAHRDRRYRAARRIDRRRPPGLDAGRLDRLQSFGQRADPAARRAADGADADLAVPPAPLARRAPQGFTAGDDRNLEADKRPVAAVADHFEIRRVVEVEVAMDKATSLVLLHDPGHSLDERILREQFLY